MSTLELDEVQKKILLIPAGGQNPYHSLLKEGLERIGYKTYLRGTKLFFPLTRSMLDTEADTVHVNWTHPFFITPEVFNSKSLGKVVSYLRGIHFLADAFVSKKLSSGLVWTIHNKHNHEKNHTAVEILVNRIFSRMVDKVKAPCSSAKDTVMDLYDLKSNIIEVIPEGNYIRAYENEIGKEEARIKLEIEEEFVFLFFGIIRDYKNVVELIDKFKDLQLSGSRLLIVGNPWNDDIKNEVISKTNGEDKIDIKLDYIPSDKVQIYMNAADVLVLPYKDILNSGSVMLGMSFGKPIVAPNIGCIPDVIGDETLLYEDSGDLKNSLRKARECTNLESISKSNFDKAKELSWESVSDQIDEMYKSL